MSIHRQGRPNRIPEEASGPVRRKDDMKQQVCVSE
jgi:hypothetical protein